jgi:hypothetical protein
MRKARSVPAAMWAVGLVLLAAPAYSESSRWERPPLARTAAVVRGVVQEIRYSYDDVQGPRTLTRLEGLEVHLGALEPGVQGELTIDSFGGYKPNGRFISEVHTPGFLAQSRVLLFLSNLDWFYSPVVDDLAFRIERVGGKEVVVAASGEAVIGWSDQGPVLGVQLFEQPELREQAAPTLRKEVSEEAIDALPALDQVLASVRRIADQGGLSIGGRFESRPTLRGARWNTVPTSPGESSSTKPDTGGAR